MKHQGKEKTIKFPRSMKISTNDSQLEVTACHIHIYQLTFNSEYKATQVINVQVKTISVLDSLSKCRYMDFQKTLSVQNLGF